MRAPATLAGDLLLYHISAGQYPPAVPRAPRRSQRIAWAVSASPVGNLFFRRLRGKKGERIRSFTDKNLFAGESDDVWGTHAAASFDSRHASMDCRETTPTTTQAVV